MWIAIYCSCIANKRTHALFLFFYITCNICKHVGCLITITDDILQCIMFFYNSIRIIKNIFNKYDRR